MLNERSKYPIVGVILKGNVTKIRYSDGSVSGGIVWRSVELARDYCVRVMPPERIEVQN